MRFDLYLESGPQRKRTWIFVPGLPGCSAMAPTSEEAPEAAGRAIRGRLAFLTEHGETELTGGRPIAEAERPELSIAEHVIERKVLGFGQQFFEPDLEPLPRADVARLIRWACWSREELVAAARAQKLPLAAKAESGRSALGILGHVGGAELGYVGSTLGTIKGGGAVAGAIESAAEPWEALAEERRLVTARLESISDEDLRRVVRNKDGAPRWTARRMFRRMLEHEWEHVLELRARL